MSGKTLATKENMVFSRLFHNSTNLPAVVFRYPNFSDLATLEISVSVLFFWPGPLRNAFDALKGHIIYLLYSHSCQFQGDFHGVWVLVGLARWFLAHPKCC